MVTESRPCCDYPRFIDGILSCGAGCWLRPARRDQRLGGPRSERFGPRPRRSARRRRRPRPAAAARRRGVGRPGAEGAGDLGEAGMERTLAVAGRRADRVVRLRISITALVRPQPRNPAGRCAGRSRRGRREGRPRVVRMGRQRLVEAPAQARVVIFQAGDHEGVLRGEAAIQARLRDAGPGHDLVDPDAPEAAQVEQLAGRRPDPVAGPDGCAPSCPSAMFGP